MNVNLAILVAVLVCVIFGVLLPNYRSEESSVRMLSQEPLTHQHPELRLQQDITRLAETCIDHIQAIYGGTDDCSINDSIIAVVEQYDITSYNPPVQQDCYEETIQVPGTEKSNTMLSCPWERAPTSYSILDTESLVDAAFSDPVAAVELSERTTTRKESVGWLLQAAALSPNPQKATGPLLRIAKIYRPTLRLETNEVAMDPVIRRIVFEEMAAERGNPIARPNIWWDYIEQRFPERIRRTRLLVDSIKQNLEISLAERRSRAGLANE